GLVVRQRDRPVVLLDQGVQDRVVGDASRWQSSDAETHRVHFPASQSSSSALSASGAATGIQCPPPSIRSYRHSPATCSPEPTIWRSVRARSFDDHTPITGSSIGG